MYSHPTSLRFHKAKHARDIHKVFLVEIYTPPCKLELHLRLIKDIAVAEKNGEAAVSLSRCALCYIGRGYLMRLRIRVINCRLYPKVFYRPTDAVTKAQ
jgi:hypothetical protein